MWIDLDAVDSQDMIHQDLDSTGKITEKIIIIPTFDLYSHEVGDDNGKKSSNNVSVQNSMRT